MLVENHELFILSLYLTSPLGESPSEYCCCLARKNNSVDTRWWKKFDNNVYSFWHNSRTLQDRQTHRHHMTAKAVL